MKYSRLEQAYSFVSVIVKSIKNKNLLCEKELVKVRLDKCNSCKHLINKDYRGRIWLSCEVCGCEYKRKIMFKESKCPIGEW